MHEVRSQWFDVRGLRIHARTAPGPRPSGTALILVHGLVVSSRYLSDVCAKLGPYYPTWAPDLPGYGRSEDPGRVLSLAELADAVVDFMDAAEVPRAVLLGQSFGCQIVAETAVRHPQRVERLVLQGPGTEPKNRSVSRYLFTWARNARKDDSGMGPIMVKDYWDAGWNRFVETFQMSRKDAIEEKLPRIDVPVLVLTSEKDPLSPPSWGAHLASLLPQGRHVVLEGIAHTAVFSSPLQVTRAVHPFLKGEPLPASIPHPSRSGPKYVAAFDSASGMLRATGLALHRDDFRGLGVDHPLEWLLPAANYVPTFVRKQIYSMGGWGEAVSPRTLAKKARLEDLDRWMVDTYPRRPYPAVFLGSSNGAVAHLAAAMGVPWLPQTLLLPVRRFGSDVNDPRSAMEWGRGPGRALLDANPDLVLHHMHDPNQDYLMSRHMAYFRVKRQRMGELWESFLRETLEPGGTIYVVECEQKWPSTRVDDRHWFQTGGVGGIEPEEYLHGSPRVARFLAEQGVKHRRWDSPAPDEDVPEAEWGFDPALGRDVQRFADAHGYRVQRIRYPGPDDLSGPIADLFRAWYRDLGRPTNRLLVECFVVMEPWWALRTGSVPYWTSFAVQAAVGALEEWLDATQPFDHISAMLFSHGMQSAGLADIERWRGVLHRARVDASFVGTDPAKFPRDFGVLRRYHTELPKRIQSRLPMPPPLPLERVERWLADRSPKAAPEGRAPLHRF